MNTATKVVLVLGAMFLIGGIAMFAVGVGSVSNLEEADFPFDIENQTSGTITIDDKDGVGDIGITFWVEGTYEDLNENGVWDVCENIQITITDVPEINNEWDYAENYDGDFYFEVVHNHSGGGESDCSDDTKNKELSRSEDGFVKIGRACYACYAGNVSFESNQPVWVTYDDPILEEIMDEVVGIFAGFGLGFVGTCCGIIFLIIGLIMALTMKDDNQQKMMYMPPEDNMLVAQQTGGQPTTTHMSQPDFGQPPQGGLQVILWKP